jgi:hypothetical protein
MTYNSQDTQKKLQKFGRLRFLGPRTEDEREFFTCAATMPYKYTAYMTQARIEMKAVSRRVYSKYNDTWKNQLNVISEQPHT